MQTILFVTKPQLENMNKELEELKGKRIAIALEIQKAAADKDLSENGAYHAVREKTSFLEGKIQELQQQINTAKIVTGNERAGIGSTVSIEDIKSNTITNYKIVTKQDIDFTGDKISHDSPLAKGIAGRRIGEVVEIKIPSGTRKIRIVDIFLSKD